MGVVTATGEAATEWKDRRVIAPSLSSCGECDFCRRGAPQGCADAVRLDAALDRGGEHEVRARYLAAADGELEVAGASAAVLGSDGLCAYAAFCVLGVAPAEPLVALGTGTRTELVKQIGHAKSAAVLDLDRARAEHGAKPWRAFALAADRTELGEPLALLPAGSSLAVSTLGGHALSVDAKSLVDRGITVSFIGDGHPDLLPELVALAARRELDLDATVEQVGADDASADRLDAINRSGRCAIIRHV